MNLDRLTFPIVQISLDVTSLEDAIETAAIAVDAGVDWLDPHHWDLVINAGRIDQAATVDMLVHYTESLIRDPALRAGLAARAAHAVGRFSLRAMAQHMQEIYLESSASVR